MDRGGVFGAECVKERGTGLRAGGVFCGHGATAGIFGPASRQPFAVCLRGLLAACRLSSALCCPLSAVCCSLSAICRLLSTVRDLPSAGCRPPSAICRSPCPPPRSATFSFSSSLLFPSLLLLPSPLHLPSLPPFLSPLLPSLRPPHKKSGSGRQAGPTYPIIRRNESPTACGPNGSTGQESRAGNFCRSG